LQENLRTTLRTVRKKDKNVRQISSHWKKYQFQILRFARFPPKAMQVPTKNSEKKVSWFVERTRKPQIKTHAISIANVAIFYYRNLTFLCFR
jgi:hypothetical protein